MSLLEKLELIHSKLEELRPDPCGFDCKAHAQLLILEGVIAATIQEMKANDRM